MEEAEEVSVQLPKGVRPISYKLRITPDIPSFSFKGEIGEQ